MDRVRGGSRRLGVVTGALFASFIVLALVGCSGSAIESGNSSGSGVHADQITTTLNQFVASKQITGYGFMVVGKGTGRPLFKHVKGSYTVGAAPVRLAQPTLLASASKSLAATAILTLVDQGTLNLYTPVRVALAADGIVWPADKRDITLKMLLNHTSGLPGIFSNHQPACIDVTNRLATNSESMADCVQDIAHSTLDAKPGDQFIYGGADYQVAGFIAMKAAGASSWSAFFHTALAARLNASTMAYAPATGLLAQSNPRVAGGAVSSVADYAKFLQMLLDGGQYDGKTILSATSIDLLRHNQIGTLQATPPPPASASDFSGYSFGFFKDDPHLYTGSPGPEFSDQGLFGETPWIDYGLNYAAVLLINGARTNGLQTGTDMWNAIHADVIALVKARQP